MSLTVSEHPIVRVALTRLRNKETSSVVFRRELHRLSQVLAVEATQNLKTHIWSVNTPLELANGFDFSERCAFIPIMRAGSGMLNAFLDLVPNALIWHMFMSRNEQTLQPEFHGCKVPTNILEHIVCFVLDPMLATGGSACCAIDVLKKSGAKNIVFVGVLGVPEGADKLMREHPDVPILIGAMDEHLNEHGYILPGLGDAGDRLFPTV